MSRMDDETARELAERNGKVLNLGMVKARTIVNAVNRGDREAAEAATLSFLEDLWHTLDLDTQDQLALNALCMAVQLADQVNSIRAQLGNRKVK